jgi:hypothetical protein
MHRDGHNEYEHVTYSSSLARPVFRAVLTVKSFDDTVIAQLEAAANLTPMELEHFQHHLNLCGELTPNRSVSSKISCRR